MRTRSAGLLLTGFLAVGCGALRVGTPVTMDCRALRLAPLTNQEQRLEFRGRGFSVLPPPGEHWCIVSSGSRGVRFTTHPLFGSRLKAPPPPAVTAHTFSVTVLALEVRGAKVDTPDELYAFAELWLRSRGRFKTVDAQIVPDTSLGAECVRMDSVVEERDNPELPGVVFVQVNRANVLCRHPHMTRPSLVLIGAAERYVQGHMAGALLVDTRRDLVEAFVRSLRFAPPR